MLERVLAVAAREALLNAVVLGGSPRNDPLAAAHHVPAKSLIPVGEHAMAWHVLRALRDGGVSRVAYAGPLTPDAAALVDVALPDAGSMLANLEAGLAALASPERVIVATADVPLLTAAAVRDVLARDPGAALVYPVVRDADCERAFPGGRRTYARLTDGRFTGGNVFIVDPALVPRVMPRLRQVIAQRKNPVALAGLIGVSTLVKLLTRRLSIAELEQRVGLILGVPARALITPYAEVGFDVDKPEDLVAARAALDARAGEGGGR